LERLERAGISSIHPATRSSSMLDLLYLAIVAVGFLLLWAIANACERV
jgi:hypothetical protein